MGLLNDESAQGSTEWILLIGGIIVIAVIAITVYLTYARGLGNGITSGNNSSLSNTTNQIQSLNPTLNQT